MAINLKQFEENILYGVCRNVVRVEALHVLKRHLDKMCDDIDNAKMEARPLANGAWTIQKNEPEVAEALDEVYDKIVDAICAIEIAERKAKKDAEWYYRNAQRKVFFDEA